MVSEPQDEAEETGEGGTATDQNSDLRPGRGPSGENRRCCIWEIYLGSPYAFSHVHGVFHWDRVLLLQLGINCLFTSVGHGRLSCTKVHTQRIQAKVDEDTCDELMHYTGLVQRYF